MSVAFTDRYIKALKANLGQKRARDIRELGKKGFGISVFPSGEKSFFYIYYFNGRKRRLTLGKYPDTSLSDAHSLYKAAKQDVKDGTDPGAVKQIVKRQERDASTIEGLIETYIEMYAKEHKRSWKEDKRILEKEILKPWGKRKAKDITKQDVLGLLDSIKRRAPIGANRTFACIRKMFNFAIKRDIIETSPCSNVDAPSKERRRDRCLSVDEIKIFWSNLDDKLIDKEQKDKVHIEMTPSVRIALKLQLATAQRKAEIASMRWDEVDLETRWWTIPADKAKNGIAQRVYLSDLALELLAKAKEYNEKHQEIRLKNLPKKKNLTHDVKLRKCEIYNNALEWVFPSWDKPTHIHPTAISRSTNRSTFEKELAHFTPHDLRRTTATHMTAMGISRLVVSKILNHADGGVTAIYDRHSYDAEKKRALEAWSDKLYELLNSSNHKSNITNLNERKKRVA